MTQTHASFALGVFTGSDLRRQSPFSRSFCRTRLLMGLLTAGWFFITTFSAVAADRTINAAMRQVAATSGEATENDVATGLGDTPRRIYPRHARVDERRPTADLHAIDVSSEGVAIAVGDLGCILRRDVPGNRVPADRVSADRVSADGEIIDASIGTASRDAAAWRMIATPTEATLWDVRFLDAQRVIAVGGWYEEITRRSRGVVLMSVDAGRTFFVAHPSSPSGEASLPMLRQVDPSPEQPSAFVVRGDWCPVRRSTTMVSRDGGQTFQPFVSSRGTEAVTQPTPHDRRVAVETPKHPVGLHSNANSRLAVGAFGTIRRLSMRGETGQTLRRPVSASGVVVVAKDVAQVPWSEMAIESLLHGSAVRLWIPKTSTTTDAQRGWIRQASLGIGVPVDFVDGDWRATMIQARSSLGIRPETKFVIDGRLDRDVFSSFVASANLWRYRPDDSTAEATSEIIVPELGRLMSDFRLDVERILLDAAPPPSGMVFDHGNERFTRLVRGWTSRTELSRRASAPVPPTGQSRTNAETQTSWPPGQRTTVANNDSRHRLQTTTARMSWRLRIEDGMRKMATDPHADPAAMRQLFDTALTQLPRPERRRAAWQLWSMANHFRSTVPQSGGISPTHSTDLRPELLAVLSRWNRQSPMFGDQTVARWAAWMRERMSVSSERQRLATVWRPEPPSPIQRVAHVSVSPFERSNPTTDEPSGFSIFPTTSRAEPPVAAASASGDGVMGTSSFMDAAAPPIDLAWLQSPLIRWSDVYRSSIDASAMQDVDVIATRDRDMRGVASEMGMRTISVQRFDERPVLDAELSEWATVSPRGRLADESAAARSRPQRLMVGQDGDFIYIAGTIAVSAKSPSAGQRSVLRWRLDLDGDLQYPIELSIDARQNSRVRIDGREDWTPQWYVATDGWGEQQLTFELAVRRTSLSDATRWQPEAFCFLDAEVVSEPEPPRSDARYRGAGTHGVLPGSWTAVVGWDDSSRAPAMATNARFEKGLSTESQSTVVSDIAERR